MNIKIANITKGNIRPIQKSLELKVLKSIENIAFLIEFVAFIYRLLLATMLIIPIPVPIIQFNTLIVVFFKFLSLFYY
jgi:hypothetical protein